MSSLSPEKTCEWDEIDPGCGVYNTCGEEWHVPDGLDPPNFCCECGGRVVIVYQQPSQGSDKQ